MWVFLCLLLFMFFELMMFIFFFSCGFDVHVLLFWVFSLILHLMSLLSLFLVFKKNIEEQVLMFLPKKIMKVNMMMMMMMMMIIIKIRFKVGFKKKKI